MVIDAVLNILIGGVTAILSLLPTWSPMPDPPSYITGGGFGSAFAYLKWANWYFPVDEALTVGAGLAAFLLLLGLFKATEWTLTKTHITGD